MQNVKGKSTQVEQKKETSKPEYTTRIGNIQLAVWRSNDGKFLNTSFKKSYLDEETQKWAESTSYNRNDLLKLRVIVDKAIDYVTSIDETISLEE